MFAPQVAIQSYINRNGEPPSINELVRLSGNSISKGAAHVELGKWKMGREVVKRKKLKDIPFHLLRVCLLFVSMVAAAVSVYYSFIWLRSYMINGLAVLFACALVLFSTTGFSIRRYMDQSAARLLTLAMSIFVLLFSIVCTVAGQVEISSTERGETENSYIAMEIESLEKQISQAEVDLVQAQHILEQFDTLEDRRSGGGNPYYNSMQDRQVIQDRLNGLQEDLRISLQEQRKNEVETTLFDALDRMDLFKFILFLIPAIFLDVIAPLGLYIVFDMKEEK